MQEQCGKSREFMGAGPVPSYAKLGGPSTLEFAHVLSAQRRYTYRIGFFGCG
jgi:hypothetical protein